MERLVDMSNFEMVKEFHEAFGLDINTSFDKKILSNEKLVNLRISLIEEETNELVDAIKDKDFIEIRDAIGDIIYVINGMAVSFGFNIDLKFKFLNKIENNNSIFENVKEIYHNIKKFDKSNYYNSKEVNQNIRIIDDISSKLTNYIYMKSINDIENYTIHLLTRIYLLGYLYDIDVDTDFKLIHLSNMSKLCKDEEEAKLTVAEYKKKYDNNNSPYDSPAYRLSDNGKYYVVYNKSTNKILKSIVYAPVDLR